MPRIQQRAVRVFTVASLLMRGLIVGSLFCQRNLEICDFGKQIQAIKTKFDRLQREK